MSMTPENNGQEEVQVHRLVARLQQQIGQQAVDLAVKDSIIDQQRETITALLQQTADLEERLGKYENDVEPGEAEGQELPVKRSRKSEVTDEGVRRNRARTTAGRDV